MKSDYCPARYGFNPSHVWRTTWSWFRWVTRCMYCHERF